ncbi:MAG: 23S rRNA (guanosine(2251)-2'-O)-methyltransferase RlmB [Pseudomonadales bacterium]
MSLVFGHHSVRAVLADDPGRVRIFYVQKGRPDERTGELLAIAKSHGLRIESVERRWLDSRVDGSHQGVAVECQAMQLASEAELELRWPTFGAAPLILILDGVTDPRNLGACLRSAAGAGVDAVLVPKRGSAPVNEVVQKTAAGALPGLFLVEVSNLARRMKWLAQQGVWMYGTDDQATVGWSQADYTGAVAFVLGNEAKGLRALTREHCDHLVSIPMAGSVASLNVAVATGVVLFEAVRQRQA